MNIPNELLREVVLHLSKADMKHLRLSCKGLAKNVACFPFDSIFLSTDPLDLKAAEHILTRFSACLRIIIVSPIPYTPKTLESYERCVLTARDYVQPRREERFKAHQLMGYKLYCTVQERAQGKDKAMEDLFQRILTPVPSIRRIVVTYRHRIVNLTDKEMQTVCRWKSCKMPRDHHRAFKLNPLQTRGTDESPDLENISRLILKASPATVKDLFMEPRQPYMEIFRVNMESFLFFHQLVPETAAFLADLRKLRLGLDTRRERQTDAGFFARYLSQATNLECLSLEQSKALGRPSKGTFRTVLAGCQFPQLRVLALDGFEFEGDELITLLKDTPRLEHLVIEFCDLEGALWKNVIEKIKVTTKLASLHMARLGGGLDNVAFVRKRHGRYSDFNGDVAQFLHHGGPNPFSEAPLARILQGPDIHLMHDPWNTEYYERYFEGGL